MSPDKCVFPLGLDTQEYNLILSTLVIAKTRSEAYSYDATTTLLFPNLNIGTLPCVPHRMTFYLILFSFFLLVLLLRAGGRLLSSYFLLLATRLTSRVRLSDDKSVQLRKISVTGY